LTKIVCLSITVTKVVGEGWIERGKCRETGILLLGEETKPQKYKQANKQKEMGIMVIINTWKCICIIIKSVLK
jgi:hypothetical protein